MSRRKLEILKRRDPLRVGFLPLIDCAPLVYAREAGLFTKYDLDVELQRETSWSAIRDKVINGDLDAAQTPATLPFMAGLGVDSDPCACVSGLVLSLQGNAIVISKKLWSEGVSDAEALKRRIHSKWGKRTYNFGVPFPYSSQEILLRRWLKSGGIMPDSGVRIVAVPPDQLFPTLKLGYIDGFCAGEPWTALTVQAGAGATLTSSAQLAPLHPEMVLAVRQSFALGRSDEHQRLVMALLEACAFCDLPQTRRLLVHLLAQRDYVNAPVECFEAGWIRGTGAGNAADALIDTILFSQQNANEPGDEKARWIIEGLYELLENNPFLPRELGRAPVLKNVFRHDLFDQATRELQLHGKAASAEPPMFETVLKADCG